MCSSTIKNPHKYRIKQTLMGDNTNSSKIALYLENYSTQKMIQQTKNMVKIGLSSYENFQVKLLKAINNISKTIIRLL